MLYVFPFSLIPLELVIEKVSSLSRENNDFTLEIFCVSNPKLKSAPSILNIEDICASVKSLYPNAGSEHDNFISKSSLKILKVEATQSSSFSTNLPNLQVPSFEILRFSY